MIGVTINPVHIGSIQEFRSMGEVVARVVTVKVKKVKYSRQHSRRT